MIASRLMLICVIAVSATSMNTTDGALDLSMDIQETTPVTASPGIFTEWRREHEVEEDWEDITDEEKADEHEENEEIHEHPGGHTDWIGEVREDQLEKIMEAAVPVGGASAGQPVGN